MKQIFISLFLLLIIIFPIRIYSQYQKVSHNNVDIYYRDFGSGTPILIIGGGPGDHSDRYLELCNLLSKNFRCILPDQRGTGKSIPANIDTNSVTLELTIEDFEAIRKQLNLKKWTIIGFSYGGYLASYYTHNYPNSIENLIFLSSMGLNTNMFGHFLDNIESRLNNDDLKKIEYWSDSIKVSENRYKATFEIIKARMPGYFYKRKNSLQVTETMQISHFNFDLGQFLWHDIMKNNIAKKENNFTGPVLIIQGRQDPLGEGVAISINNYYNQSTLVFIEKAGHYIWFEQPENLSSTIINFLQNL